MTKKCQNCMNNFEGTDDDLLFLKNFSPEFSGKKYNLPLPSLCPDCRQQRRLCFRNERTFYKRKCDATGEEMISVYSPKKICRVYSQDYWWSDNWDPLEYGRDFDFSRSFFEQYLELSNETPRPCIVNMSSENSLYTNHACYNKNCFMCMNTGYSEDLVHCSNYCIYNKDCVDCLAIQHSEMCYFCTDVKKSAFSSYLHECIQCTDCHFCYDCQSCQNCFGCFNLRQKKYCIFNTQYTKDEYQKKLNELEPKTRDRVEETFINFQALIRNQAIHKKVIAEQCEFSRGDHLYNCKNTQDSYYTFDTEDSAYCYDCGDMKNVRDVTEPFTGELQYETHACNINYNLLVCSKCYENDNLSYCQYCWYSSHLFGCFGMRNKEYCILNKQYTKEEYEKLVPKIIEHMIQTEEWGEFFPTSISPFDYNETVALEYYPLTKEASIERGLGWHDPEGMDFSAITKKIPAEKLSQPIAEIPDDILNWAIECRETNQPFRIQKAELEFYRKMKIPVPHLHPNERHAKRMALRSPRKLWKRNCMKCKKSIESTYSPDRQEIVYCQECYLEAVY